MWVLISIEVYVHIVSCSFLSLCEAWISISCNPVWYVFHICRWFTFLHSFRILISGVNCPFQCVTCLQEAIVTKIVLTAVCIIANVLPRITFSEESTLEMQELLKILLWYMYLHVLQWNISASKQSKSKVRHLSACSKEQNTTEQYWQCPVNYTASHTSYAALSGSKQVEAAHSFITINEPAECTRTHSPVNIHFAKSRPSQRKNTHRI